MLLSPEQVAELTDSPQPKRQIEWLIENRWVFVVSAAGRPKISSTYYAERMERQRAGIPESSHYEIPLIPTDLRCMTPEIRAKRSPKWRDKNAIDAIYVEAKRITLETGVPHQVDHVIPLSGERVSGLHVHYNLQILTKSENCRKKNKYVCS